MSRPAKDPAAKGLGKKATAGVTWGFLREGVSEILVFPASMVLARLLTPQEFGIATAANFFSHLALRLSELGLNATIIRAKELRPIQLSTIFVINLTLGFVNFCALSAAAPLVGAFYGIPEPGHILRVAAFSFLISPLGTVPAALLGRNLEYKKAAVVDWVQLVVYSLSGVVLAWLGFSYMSLVYSRLAATISATLLRIVFAKWRPSLRFSWSTCREALSYGTGVHAKRLLEYAALQGDNLVVGKFMGMGALGLYDKAFSTMNRFLTRMNTGGPGVMFRIFSVIHDDPDRFRRAYQKVVMSASLMAFPTFAGLVVIAPQLMTVLFGAQWLPAAEPFQLLCIAAAFKILNAYAGSVMQATGRVWADAWRQGVLVVLVVTGIIVLRDWGPVGAATAVLVATCVSSVLVHSLLRRVTGLRWLEILHPLKPALMCAAGVTVVAFLVGVAVRSVSAQPSPLILLACQVPAAALFAAVFVLFAPIRELRLLVRDVTRDLAPPAIKRQSWAQTYWDRSVGEDPGVELA